MSPSYHNSARYSARVAEVSSFDPIANRDARVLLVGSMPGVASLQAHRYYAHPRNAFWPILAAFCGFDAEEPYARRLLALRRARLALWDVLGRCHRQGSLDADIDAASMVANDFAGFLATHPQVHAVGCNGGTAHRLFRKLVVPTLPRPLEVVPLPSTSPAHARMSLADKQTIWLRELERVIR